MAENPYISGEFYAGEFISTRRRFTFRDPIRDERRAYLVEIEPVVEAHVFSIKLDTRIGFIPWYYHIDGLGVLQKIEGFFGEWPEAQMPEGVTAWYVTSADHPAYLVFTDANDNLHYMTHDTSGNLVVTTTVPEGTEPWQSHYVGPYLELLAADGYRVYRLTVNADNTYFITLHREEPWRIQTVCLSQGMPYAFRENRLYTEAVIEVADVEMRLDETEWGYGGVMVPRAGGIRIALGDGELDWLATQKWDSRDITIFSGSTTEDVVTWPIILRGQTQSAEWDDDEFYITLRDYATYFERSLQPNTYDGSLFEEGTADVQGRKKPLLYGFVQHAQPVLIDPIFWVFQIHDGPVHQILHIHDQGLTLAGLNMRSSTTFESVWEWSPTEGQAGSCMYDVNTGLLRFAAPPAGTVTITGRGSTDTPFNARVSDIVRAIARRTLPEIAINESSFGVHAARFPYEAGIYIQDESRVGEVLHELTAPTGGYVSIDRLGNMQLGLLERRTPRQHLTDTDIIADARVRRTSPPKPGQTYRAGGGRSYSILNPEQLAGAIPAFRRAFLSNEYRYAPIPQPQPYIRYDSAKEITIETVMTNTTSAFRAVDFIAFRQQVYRDLYTITVNEYLFQFEVGDTVILELSRFGFAHPRYFLVVGVYDRTSEEQTQLTLWG